MKMTTTQWTTTTTRKTQGKGLSNADLNELDTVLDNNRWERVIKDVERMPLHMARRLRQRIEELFT